MLTPKQKEVLDAFNETFNQELEVLERRKDLIHTWKELRATETLKNLRERLIWKDENKGEKVH
tara:strand:- start:49 stop:237 length:189 start_codon:yes stop_codon:yes gene_type:complete